VSRAVSIGAVCLLLLGGCGKQPEQQGNTSAPPKDYQAQLTAMGDAERNLTFMRAIHDAGWQCGQVQSSAPRPPIQDSPAWKAVCDGNAEWAIEVGKSGIAQVAKEADIEAAKEKATR
jgi:hypothetical protein